MNNSAARNAQEVLADERIVSADSHIMEPLDLWDKNLTPSLKTKLPKIAAAKYCRGETRRLGPESAAG